MLLMRQEGQVVTKEEFIERVWHGTAISDSALTRAISLGRRALRTLLGYNPVRSVYGTGYQLVLNSDYRTDSSPNAGGFQLGKPFVGRKRELLELDSLLKAAEAGTGALHLITGPPGIGKSRLLTEAVRRAASRSFEIRQGSCSESGGAPPFWPWIQILRQEVTAQGWPTQLAPQHLDRLKRLVDLDASTAGARHRPRLIETSTDRFGLFDAIAQLLVRKTRRVPLLVALDDLHQSDEGSLLMLEFLSDQVQSSQIVIAGAYRQPDFPATTRARHRLDSLAARGATSIAPLPALSKSEVSELIVDAQMPASMRDELYEQSGGNPLFLHHLLSLLEGQQEPVARTRPLPHFLHEAIEQHAALVSSSSRKVLAVASVVGREFELWLLSAVIDDLSGVTRALSEALRHGLLTGAYAGGRRLYRFAHALVRDVLYDALGDEDRARVHLKAAEALAASNAADQRLSEIAHHYRSGLPFVEPARAIQAILAAAQQAAASYAYEEAVSLLREALALADSAVVDKTVRADCLIGLADALSRLGDRHGAWAACAAAAEVGRQLADPAILAKAALAMSPGFLSIETSYYNQAHVDLLEEAIRLQRDDCSMQVVALWSRLALALHWSGRESRRKEASDRALRVAKALGGREARARALFARHSVLCTPDSTEARAELAHELVEISSSIGDGESLLLYHSLLISDLAELGDIQALEREIARFRAAADQTRQPDSVWLSPMFAGMLELLRGSFHKVRELNRELRSLGQRVSSEDATNCLAAQEVLCDFETGAGPKVVGELVRHSRAHPNVLELFQTAPAWAAAELGLTEESAVFLRAFSRSSFASVPRDMNWLGSMIILAMASAELRDELCCAQLLERLEPYASRFAVLGYCVVGFGSVAAHLGRLAGVAGRDESAERYFTIGLRTNSEAGARPWTARCRYARGDWLIANGMLADGRADVTEALAEADRLGMRHLALRCRQVLA